MRILYVVDYYQPQLGYSEYYVPVALRELGHEVTILTSNYYYPFPNYSETSGKILGPRKQKSGRFEQEGITVIKEPLLFELFTRSIFMNHEKHVKAIKPDLVIVNKSAGFNTIRMAQLKKKYEYTLLSYDAHLPSGFYAVGNLLFKQIFYFIFRLLFSNLLNTQVDKFIAVQEETEIIMREFYGQKDIVHIPLGTDTKRFKYSKKEGLAVRKALKIKPSDFVILYSGKLIPTKGIHILFQAFKILSQKYPNVQLILVGNGPEEYVKDCIKELDGSNVKRVHLVGFKDNKELYKYYSAADVGVWPLEESTAMNDIAACKKPFIANDSIGARVRLSNNNALLYEKNNSSDLACKIELLINDTKLADQMGVNGLELIKKKLSWESIVKQYVSYVAT